MRKLMVVAVLLINMSAFYGSGSAAQASSKSPLVISPIEARFIPSRFQTDYNTHIYITVPKSDETVTIKWILKLELVDKAGTPSPSGGPGSGAAVDVLCNNNGVGVSAPVMSKEINVRARGGVSSQFVWHHPSPPDSNPPGRYHCNHLDEGPRGHQGLVSVVVSNKNWTCTATYKGTESSLATKGNQPNMNVRNGTASEPTCRKIS